jgi:hypothetical protein
MQDMLTGMSAIQTKAFAICYESVWDEMQVPAFTMDYEPWTMDKGS